MDVMLWLIESWWSLVLGGNHTKELMPRRAVKVVESAPPSRTVAHPLPP